MSHKQTFLNSLTSRSTPSVARSIGNLFGARPKKTEVERIKEGIAKNETGGLVVDKVSNRLATEAQKYSYRQPAGNSPANEDLGKYQVTSDELATYAPRYLGRSISPNEFVGDPSAQEIYMDNKIKRFLGENNTPEQIADIHRRGLTNASPAGSTVYQDPEYVRNFRKTFRGLLKDFTNN